MQDIKKLGKKYDVKEVSDGYARNFLIARKLAVPADEKAMAFKANQEAGDHITKQKYVDLAKRLEGEALEFKVKTGMKSEVFGSVTVESVKKELQNRGYGDADIDLNKPLKTLGDHKIRVNFGKGVFGTAKVRLQPAS